MKLLTITIMTAAMAFGQQTAKKDEKPAQVAKAENPAAPKFPKPLDEVTALKLENLQLKAQKAQSDIDAFSKEYGLLIAAKCAENQLSSTECVVGKDQSGSWMVGKNQPPPPPVEKKQ